MANQLFKLLYGLYHCNIPVCVFGNPGKGKTATIKHLGEVLQVPCELVSGNKLDPTDLSGIPYLDEVKTKSGKLKKITKYSKPKYVRRLSKCSNGILFFDEISTCPASIQVALLSIIQDCEFGEYSIPKTTFRVCAGNYTNVLGNHDISLAFHNRCVNLFIKSDIERYCKGIVSGFRNYEYAVINTLDEQKAKDIQYRVAVSDFLMQNPKFLPEDLPEDLTDLKSVAFPTERSWENVVKVLSVLDGNTSDYLQEIIDGLIGLEASRAFRRYLEKTDRFINLLDYIGKESKLILPHPEKHDESMHMMESITNLINEDPRKYCKLLCRIINILHNKNKLYGQYIGYDGWIVKFLLQCIESLDEKQLLTKELILKLHGIIKSDYSIDDFSKLYTLSYNGIMGIS